MKTSIETYNELLPFINTLVRDYRVDANHNDTMGYGFYIDATKDLYVKISIWGDEVSVKLNRRNSKCAYDIINDINVKITKDIMNINEVKKVTMEYLKYAKTLEPIYRVELTESELSTIINLVDGKLKEKLNSHLQTK